MRKYIDCIRVTDTTLAYKIVEALEKGDNYSVDFYNQNDPMMKRGERTEIELRVYRNEKVTPAPAIGFSEGDTENV
jgi:hypothetical protein